MNTFSSNPSYFPFQLMIPLILGGWLALISYPTPAKGQISTKHILLAQRRPSVYQNLPPAPPIPGTGSSDDILPPLPTSPQGYTTPQRYIDFQAPLYQNYRNRRYTDEQVAPLYQANRNGRYLVYVNSNNLLQLQQVHQIEPEAYIKRFQGRYVIQAGVFNRESNAKERVKQLRSYGINDVRLVRSSNRGEISYSPGRQNDFVRHPSKYYYVAIPAKSQDLLFIEDRIRQSVGFNIGVGARNHPLGSHIAVGPFNQYLEADAWNNYLQKLGFGNARVYYGR